MKKDFSEKAILFFKKLNPNFNLPKDVSFLLPYDSSDVKILIRNFFLKYYSDQRERTFIFGINPGRLGAGTTGIAFTDPVQLEKVCGIENSLLKKPELSSTFIYTVINEFGGDEKFFSNFFLTAICPVGFVKNGKSLNYYDDPTLIKSCKSFIHDTIQRQISFGVNRKIAICLGEGKNFNYFKKLNDELKLFKEIVKLPHPRFIMQYRRQKINYHVQQYVRTMDKILTT